MKKRLLLSSLIAVAFILGMGSTAYAFDPPYSISIQTVKAFQNLVEDGDMVIVFHYRIKYIGTYPGVSAAKSFSFLLYSADGILLATRVPFVYYAFETNGYGDGISSFYFTDDDAPDWSEIYQIKVFGSPAYFNPVPTFTYTMTGADYSGVESQEANRKEMYAYIMSLCDDFSFIYPDALLKSTTDAGVVLSVRGDAYFRGAIPGLQAMCPKLFFIQTYIPEKMPVEPYTMELQEQYTPRLEGTDVMRGADRLGAVIGGVSGKFVLGIFTFGLCIGLCIWTMRKGWGVETGMVASAVIGVGGALLIGDWLFTLAMIGGLVAAMAIMYIFAYKRA